MFLNLAGYQKHPERLKEKKKKADFWTPPQTYEVSVSVGKTENPPVLVPTAFL